MSYLINIANELSKTDQRACIHCKYLRNENECNIKTPLIAEAELHSFKIPKVMIRNPEVYSCSYFASKGKSKAFPNINNNNNMKTTPPKNYSKGYGMRPGMGSKPVTDSNPSRHKEKMEGMKHEKQEMKSGKHGKKC